MKKIICQNCKAEFDENETKRFQNKTIKITIIAILFAFACGMIILAAAADDIRYDRREKAIEAHAAEYAAEIDKLMADRDYLAIAAYFSANRIYYTAALTAYDPIYTTSSNYASFYENLVELLSVRAGNLENQYHETESEIIESIGKAVSNINDARKVDDYLQRKGAYSEEQIAYMDDLTNNVILLVEAYFNVPEEEAEKIPELSEARIIVMLEDYYG